MWFSQKREHNMTRILWMKRQRKISGRKKNDWWSLWLRSRKKNIFGYLGWNFETYWYGGICVLHTRHTEDLELLKNTKYNFSDRSIESRWWCNLCLYWVLTRTAFRSIALIRILHSIQTTVYFTSSGLSIYHSNDLWSIDSRIVQRCLWGHLHGFLFKVTLE